MKHFLVAILMLVAVQGFGQAKVWVKFGDEALAEGDNYGAARFYTKAWNEDSTISGLIYKLALSNKGYHNNEKSLEFFEKIEASQELRIAHPDYLFQMAELYKSLANYQKSNEYYEKSSRLNRDTRSFAYKKSKNELKINKKVLALLKDTTDVVVKNIGKGINTGVTEFYPVWLNDTTILYSTLRAFNISNEGVIEDEDYTIQIYLGQKLDSVWNEVGPLKTKGLKGVSFSDGSFDSKGNFYFSQKSSTGKYQIAKSKLLVYEKVNAKGDTVRTLELDSSRVFAFSEADLEFNFRNPFVFDKGGRQFLLFASDRTGGKGQMDLWYSENRKGNWMSPKNLGTKVNSPGNEIGPNYDLNTGRFYFASDWHYGLGGFDIFEANGVWKRPASVTNLGFPFNTSLNDLYYAPLDSLNGMFTSSRLGSVTDKDAVCCNDLFSYEYPKPEIDSALLAITTVISRDSIMRKLQRLVEEFHVTLYFHNDRPNPNSWDTITPYTYTETYESYLDSMPTYHVRNTLNKHGEDSIAGLSYINGFFDDYVHKGVEDLRVFTGELIKELDAGRKIELTVKGYASPLAKSDYNVNLTLRRINSLQNYLKRYPGGVFNKYLEETAENGGVLRIKKIPFGENRSDTLVSDNYYNTRNSVYSKEASLERKIEIINLSLIEDSIPKEAFIVDLDSAVTVFNLGLLDTNVFDWRFMLQNKNETPTKIEKVELSCDCMQSNRNEFSFEPGEVEPLDIKFDLRKYSGKVGRQIILHFANGTKRLVNVLMELPSVD